jgi:hypothetical protein
MDRFKIGDQVYTTASLDELTLKDIILFDTMAENMGLSARWYDVEQAAYELQAMTDVDAADRHPRKYLVIGVTIWAARRVAGEAAPFEDAIDFKMSDFTVLPSTEDRRPGKPKGAGKPRKSTRTSARAASRPGTDPESGTPESSRTPSETA